MGNFPILLIVLLFLYDIPCRGQVLVHPKQPRNTLSPWDYTYPGHSVGKGRQNPPLRYSGLVHIAVQDAPP